MHTSVIIIFKFNLNDLRESPGAPPMYVQLFSLELLFQS